MLPLFFPAHAPPQQFIPIGYPHTGSEVNQFFYNQEQIRS